MSFGSKMKVSAASIINNFSATGYLIHNDITTDPISGIKSGTATETEVDYFREYFEDYQLIDDRILGGDATLLLVTDVKPEVTWGFRDASNDVWGIVSVTPIEANDVKIVYQIHVRK